MKYRLCLIVPAHWDAIMGGSQYQAKLLIEHLLKHYEVEVHYLTTLHNPESRPDGYRIVRFSDQRGLRRYGRFPDALRLYRTLRDIRPHAIVQFVGCAHTGIAAFYAKLHNCDMIWRVTSDRSVSPESSPWWKIHHHVEKSFLNYGIRHARWILAQSEYQRQQIVGRFRRNNVSVLPNFHPVPPDRQVERAPRTRVVWIANLKPLKNPHAFVRLARAMAHRKDIAFLMIGRAMDKDMWTRELIEEIESVPNLEYVGERTQDEVNDILEQSGLLVNTSHYEGFSNTFIQAWMRRVPVVSLWVDPDGLLTRQGLGLMSGTETQMAVDIARLIDEPTRRLAIGARARRYAVDRHNPSNIDDLARLLLAPTTAPTEPQVSGTAG